MISTTFCEDGMSVREVSPVSLTVPNPWQNIAQGEARTRLEGFLPDVLKRQRWFGGKARPLTATHIVDAIPISAGTTDAILLLIDVTYQDGPGETYALPVTSVFGGAAQRIARETPGAILFHLTVEEEGGDHTGILYDAMWEPAIASTWLRIIGAGARFSGTAGTLQGSATAAYQSIVPADGAFTTRVLKSEQSNTSVAFGESAMLKLYRRLQPGVNPDWEIGRLLTSYSFPHSPAVGGSMEYVRSGETVTIALLQAFVRNEGDAWATTLKDLEGFLSRVPTETGAVDRDAGRDRPLWNLVKMPLSEAGRQLMASSLETAASLGQRTAALHLTLARPDRDPDFAPEPMTPEYRWTCYESMVRLWKHTAHLLSRQLALEHSIRQDMDRLLARDGDILAVFRAFVEMSDGGLCIRCHGDYHLGQILCTGSDYVVIDFEGEPARPLAERRTKHSPLYDVAGMLRSFDYASWAALAPVHPMEEQRRLEPWAAYWSRWVRAEFLRAYLAHVQDAPFWPGSQEAASLLLTVHQLEKAVYELAYELNNRPAWVGIPLKGLNEILRTGAHR
jgi:trehalose synthase-fused probable maltokinase